MRDAIEETAEEKGISVSALLRMAISEFIERHKGTTETDREIRAIGDQIKNGVLKTLTAPDGPDRIERAVASLRILGKVLKGEK